MDQAQIFQALLVLLLGGILQGTVAFGLGLFSVPLLLMIGLPVPAVLAISSVCTAIQSGSGVHHLRESVPWKEVGWSVTVRALAMVGGVAVLKMLAGAPISHIKFWIGLVMLLLVVLQAVWRPRPRPKLHGGWNLAAFTVSGFTGGLCSMGGPPLVLWVMAHDWDVAKTRAFLFASFMSLVPIQLLLLYLSFGQGAVDGIIWGALLSPMVLLGSFGGLRIGARLSKPLLRRLAFLLLFAIAVSAMWPQIARLFR